MKKAVCIGINYARTDYALHGCLNDADDWGKLLGGHGFDVAVVTEQQATKHNIVTALSELVRGLKPGDVGAITYSGHGTWVPDLDGDEPDGRDECLCPIDMGDDGRNLILDDELHVIFKGIAAGAHVLFVTDSCHSGTVFRMAPPVGGRKSIRRPRFLPPAHFLLSTPAVTKMERAFGQAPRTNAALPGLVHYAGCRDNEYSCDTEIDGRPCGAFSYVATRALAQAAAGGKAYVDAFREIRRHLPSWDYQQTPQFNALAALKKAKVFG